MYRIDQVLAHPLYAQSLARNADWETSRPFCRHDSQHLIDVARITYILVLEAGDLEAIGKQADNTDLASIKEIIYASGLMHDLARWEEYGGGENHEMASAKIAREILQETGFSGKEQDIIGQAINEHRTLGDNPSLLGKWLYRADKLSRICTQCKAQWDCNKFQQMETAKTRLIY